MGPGGAAPRGAGIGRRELDAGQRARVYPGSESPGVSGAHLLCSRVRPGRRDEGRREGTLRKRRENGPDREEGGAGGGKGPGLGGARQRGRQTQADRALRPG